MEKDKESKMGIGGLLRRLVPYVLPYRWLLVVTLALTFAGSLMAQVNAVVLDRAVDAINDLLHLDGGFQWSSAAKILITISAILLGKEVLSAVITFGQRIFGEKIRINVSRDLSLSVVDRILQFRMAFFSQDGNEPGKLQTRIDRGIMSLSNTVKNFFIDILPLFTSAVLALVLMYAANVYVGLVATAIIPVYFWITAVQGRRMKGWRHRVFGTHQQLSHGILNIIESMGVIKSFNRERVEAAKQAALQEQSTDQQMQTRRISFLYEGLKTFVEQIGTVLIIILTAYLVLVDYPGMTIGKIMYHVMLFSNVSAPIRQLHRIYDDLNDALVYAEGFFGLLDAEEEVEESGQWSVASGQQVQGRFELKNVEFTYPSGTHAIRDLSIIIEPGETTALVGLSGAGKSTIVNLLDKFYTPDSGSITLDGVPLGEWDTQVLRENIGLVLQKNHIFNGTIEENIRYGRPDASREEVLEAARKAYVYDQVMALPEGFESNATQLSGGQQQRIAIARMFLKDPPIIFLDEPTAFLDYPSKVEILNLLHRLSCEMGKTVFLSTHDLDLALRVADRVWLMTKGGTVKTGAPQNLLVDRQTGRFHFDS